MLNESEISSYTLGTTDTFTSTSCVSDSSQKISEPAGISVPNPLNTTPTPEVMASTGNIGYQTAQAEIMKSVRRDKVKQPVLRTDVK